MKLIYCPKCQDIVRLMSWTRQCICGAAKGRYVDHLNAEISPGAIPLGALNQSFHEALANRPESGLGEHFESFVIPKECPTIAVKEGLMVRKK